MFGKHTHTLKIELVSTTDRPEDEGKSNRIGLLGVVLVTERFGSFVLVSLVVRNSPNGPEEAKKRPHLKMTK